jgi:S-adenosylmethionine:tRNA ribosyltransferase-isomerase
VQLSDFDFQLPDKLIATRPASPRSSSRLLWCENDQMSDRKAFELPELLQPGDRLVLNDTKVIPARLKGTRIRPNTVQGGAASVEVTLLKPDPDAVWSCLIKPLRKVTIGETIIFDHGLTAELINKSEGQAKLHFNLDQDAFLAALDLFGDMPLPPYIAAKRATDEQDRKDYQTVFAKNSGSVAAPTASLHFDERILEGLVLKGVEISYVTLHVGAGTFLPVKVDDIYAHKMHAEYGEVSAQAADEIKQTQALGGRVIAVGTTALRLIETASARTAEISHWSGETDIFIYPGYKFCIADGLMTNFHLPKSTLLMLVSALMGCQTTKDIYSHAIENEYRFFSYGDASLLIPKR